MLFDTEVYGSLLASRLSRSDRLWQTLVADWVGLLPELDSDEQVVRDPSVVKDDNPMYDVARAPSRLGDGIDGFNTDDSRPGSRSGSRSGSRGAGSRSGSRTSRTLEKSSSAASLGGHGSLGGARVRSSSASRRIMKASVIPAALRGRPGHKTKSDELMEADPNADDGSINFRRGASECPRSTIVDFGFTVVILNTVHTCDFKIGRFEQDIRCKICISVSFWCHCH
jgi:hypothetical protein